MVNVDFNSETIFFNGQEVGKFYLTDRGKFLVLNEIRINPDFRGSGYAQETMEQIINYADEKGKILALTPSGDFGANKNKLIKWYKSLGFIMNKGKNKDYETMELMFREPKTEVNEIIRREIWTMDENMLDEDYPSSFNMEEFKKLTSFAARKRYCDQNLRKIGSGSSRHVYEIDNEKVLKLASNKKGLEQNRNEAQIANSNWHEIVAEVYDYDQNDLWIESQRAMKISKKRFKDLLGFSIEDLDVYLRNYTANSKGQNDIFGQDEKLKNYLNEHEFVYDLLQVIANWGMESGDFGRISSYGEASHNGIAEVILIDYGLTEDLYSSSYDRKKFNENELNEITENQGFLAFHGSNHEIKNFTTEFVGANEATDQEGPGIYFSTSYDDAAGYGKYIYTVKLNTTRLFDESTSENISRDLLIRLIKMSPDWEGKAQNYAENPEAGAELMVDYAYDGNDTEKDLIQQVWIEFYRYDPKEFVENMNKLGYDGQIVKRENGSHIIIYNPNVIEVQEMETKKDLNEVQFQMQNFLDNAAEDGHIRDGGYAGTAYTKPNLLVGDDLNENFFENYRGMSLDDLKKSTDFIEQNGDIFKPTGEMLSKLMTNYLIGSQNIKNSLKISNDNVKFFNNLMNIQKHLKRFGLIKEDLIYWGADDASPDSNEYKIGGQVNESRRIFNKEIYQEITDSEIVDSHKFVIDIKRKINKKQYLTDEEFDDILHWYLSMMNNKNRYFELWGVDESKTLAKFLGDILRKRGILNEDGTSLYTNTQGTVNPEDTDWNINEDIEDIDDILKSKDIYIEDFAKNIAKKLGYENAKEYGKGTQGYAYRVDNDTILKITSDKSEANEALALIGKDSKHLGHFYKVFHLNKPYEMIYIILREYLDVEPDKYDYLYRESIDEIKKLNDKNLFDASQINDIMTIGWNNANQLLDYTEEVINTNGIDNFPATLQFVGMGKDLIDNKINSKDISGDNVGFRNDDTMAYYDIGYSKKEMNSSNMNRLQYENEQIVERIMSWMPKAKAVTVKKKCKLGGNGDGTSTACNQGDISNLELTDINDDNKHRRKANTINVAEDNVNDRHYFQDIEKKINETVNDLTESIINRKEKDEIFDYSSVINDAWREPIKQGQEFYKVNFDLENDDSTKQKKTFYFNKNLRKDQPIKYEINAELWVAGGDWEFPVMYFKVEITHDYGLKLSDKEKEAKKEPEFPWDVKGNLAWNHKYVMIPPIEAGNKYTEGESDSGKYKYFAWQDESISDAGIDEKEIRITDADKKSAWKWLEDTFEKAVDDRHKMLDESVTKGSLLTEEKVEYGALMLYFDVKNWSSILSEINEEDLYDDGTGTFGKEDEPHVTILYGFHKEVKGSDFDNIIKPLNNFSVEGNKISLFENDDFDVVKIDIEVTKELKNLRDKVEKLPNTLTYKEFHPHMTIAYVKSGKGKNYVKDLKLKLESDKLVYSTKDRKHTNFKLKDVTNENKNTYIGKIITEEIMKEANTSVWRNKINIYKENLKNINFEKADKYRDGFYTKANEELKQIENGEITMDDVFFNPDSPLRNMVILSNLDAKDYRTSLENNPIEEQMIKEGDIMSLDDLPFKQEIEKLGGKIFSVGGAVRDKFLGKDSKDLDILITGIPFENLDQLLQKYGKVDAVGKSFGVIKFVPRGSTEDIDIAIPRTEKKVGDGHQGFDVTSDHSLPIEKDLERRDFTINAIAKDAEGKLIDPYGGQKDLASKIIRVVNPEAFADDPLRMLRAVQFASRFDFTIEPKTMKLIKDNASKIKEIAGERMFIELEKIVTKGDKKVGAQLLKDTGLYENMFGIELDQSIIDESPFDRVKTMGEFIYLLTRQLDNPAEVFRTTLKGDIPTVKEIEALTNGFTNATANNVKNRVVAHNMFMKSPESLKSEILPNKLKKAIVDLDSGLYPKSIKELMINGNDLMEMGLKGKEIGDALNSALINVYGDKIKNNREELLNFLANTKS